MNIFDLVPYEDAAFISNGERSELDRLLEYVPGTELGLHQLWQLMDKVWDELGCDNRYPDPKKLKQYYYHPIWLLNGLFIENHALSLASRQAIISWICSHSNIESVLDFGGGFGTLGRMLAQQSPNIQVEIYEPHPHKFALQKSISYKNLAFTSNTTKVYHCIVCTDVLEHVDDPIKLLSDMVSKLSTNGYLLIANHFYPSIKCHLPSTFHLRHTFKELAELMGLQYESKLHEDYIQIFQKVEAPSLNWDHLRTAETHSRRWFWLYESRSQIVRWAYRVKKLIHNPRASLLKLQSKYKNLFSRSSDQP
ncbi:MAG: methyltransferase domain-containing protein [Cyanobacteria bacterium P01_C01_bin.120]